MTNAAQTIPGTVAGSERLLTAEQLAERWQVPMSHVYRLARSGAVPAVRLGRYVRFRVDQVETFELSVSATCVAA